MIGWVPTLSAEVVKVATPPTRVPVPIVVAPSRNVTVPVGVPPPLVTVAVKVTGVSAAAGLADEVKAVAVVVITKVN